MRCPYCGTNLKENLSYCPECGGKLKTEDNSNDETLRLPDLSGVPLGSSTPAPRTRRSPARQKPSRSPYVAVIVIALVIAAAAAVSIAAILTTRNNAPADNRVQLPVNDKDIDIPDFRVPASGEDYSHRDEIKPESEPGPESESQSEPDEIPDEEQGDVRSEDVTLDNAEPDNGPAPEDNSANAESAEPTAGDTSVSYSVSEE